MGSTKNALPSSTPCFSTRAFTHQVRNAYADGRLSKKRVVGHGTIDSWSMFAVGILNATAMLI